MASTSYGVNDNETVKLWGRKLFREALNQTTMKKFMGDDTNSVIQVVDDTSKGPGDRLRVTLRTQLSGDGISGDSTLEGSEESLTTYTDDLLIDQLRHAVRSAGRMSEQRVPFSMRNEARLGLQDWWADRIDSWCLNQLAGYTVQSDTKYTGLNSVTAPDSNHQIWADSANNSADESLTTVADDKMTLTMIDAAVEKAETLDFPIRPLMMGGEPYYVCIMHPNQAAAVRTSTDTGQWLDIQKAAMQGGEIGKNPVFTGALGVYNRTILHTNSRIPYGVNSSTGNAVTTARRAVFCGAQSACVGWGRDNSDSAMTWFEEMFDYGNSLGVSAGLIGGVKRTIFNSESFGSLVLSTYAADVVT